VTQSTVRLTMPAKAEYLILVRLALAGIAHEVPMPETVLGDLKLAVTEVCGNAVRHAYGDDPGAVRVRFDVLEDALEVTIEDDGGGIDLEGREAVVFGEEALESGMGLAIIRAVVDEVDVARRRDGDGTVVRLTKRLAV
jgi:serine/threonine-protein kinase RsbW